MAVSISTCGSGLTIDAASTPRSRTACLSRMGMPPPFFTPAEMNIRMIAVWKMFIPISFFTRLLLPIIA